MNTLDKLKDIIESDSNFEQGTEVHLILSGLIEAQRKADMHKPEEGEKFFKMEYSIRDAYNTSYYKDVSRFTSEELEKMKTEDDIIISMAEEHVSGFDSVELEDEIWTSDDHLFEDWKLSEISIVDYYALK